MSRVAVSVTDLIPLPLLCIMLQCYGVLGVLGVAGAALQAGTSSAAVWQLTLARRS
jgi:hypothetical protein